VAHTLRSSGPVAPRATTGSAPEAARPLVVLIDNYDSFTWNLAHLLSTSGAQVEVVRNDEVTAAEVAAAAPAGVVISPGPCAPAEAGISVETVRSCAAAGIPLLGICLGHQAIAAAFGAAIIRAPRPVHGQAFEVAHDGRGVFAGLPTPFPATRYHSLIIDEPTLPPELVITARTGALPMAVRHAAAPVEGVQFHPESILTAHGAVLMANFVKSTVRSI
jgi:anthranilate synthase component 2